MSTLRKTAGRATPHGDVGVLSPAPRADRDAVATEAETFAERLRHDVGNYGHGVCVRTAVAADGLQEACAGLAGAVLLGFDDEALETLPRLPLPVVAVDSYARDAWFPIVRSDDIDGGRRAASHLLALGHRDIAFAGPDDDRSRVVRERRHGFELTLAAAHVRMRTLSPAGSSRGEGVALGHRLALGHREVTAVLAADDLLAAGIVEGLRESGVRVPTDVSVMGFEPSVPARRARPWLSSVAHDTARRSRLTADALFGATAGDAFTVGVVVVERASVGVPTPR